MLSSEITILANAKLNLYLDIVGRRTDGYHMLETVMQSIDLSDVVEVHKKSGEISVSCTNPGIPRDEKNICYKAAKLFFEQTGEQSGAEIRIIKRIPDGAGLGGGSADAAAVLYALNTLSGFPMRPEELSALGAKIGADVPFCLSGGTAVCRGIGEEIQPISPFPERFYLIVKPAFRCSTSEAYSLYDKLPIEPKSELEAFCNAGSCYPEIMYNVFERIYGNEELYALKSRLLKTEALGSCLTGSGSAVFGVYETAEKASEAASAFPEEFTAVAKPVSAGLAVI